MPLIKLIWRMGMIVSGKQEKTCQKIWIPEKA
jgi:hypothetical protein